MAHYAWLDENNIVVNVTVGVDEDIMQQGVGGSSEAWETFYSQATGYNIKRTSYNANIRGKYAGKGDSYNVEEDIFVAPQPFASWIRAGSYWQAPTSMPTNGQWYWDENNLMWQQLES